LQSAGMANDTHTPVPAPPADSRSARLLDEDPHRIVERHVLRLRRIGSFLISWLVGTLAVALFATRTEWAVGVLAYSRVRPDPR